MEKISHKDQRARATLEILRRHGADTWVPLNDLWHEVVEAVPLSEWEQESLSSTTQARGENSWRWSSTALANAGWLSKTDGLWAITEEGAAALEEFSGEQLAVESRRRYEELRSLREEQIQERLGQAWLPKTNAERRVIEAQGRVIEQGLKNGESIFSPGRSLWTRQTVSSLRTRWVSTQDRSDRDFLEKLTDQLADASDDEKLLMAEVVTVQALPIIGVGHERKMERVSRILGLMAHPVEIPRIFSEAFVKGSYHPGQSMLSRIDLAVTLILNMLDDWTQREQGAQEELLTDPKAWKQFVYTVEGKGFPTQRNSLLYLVHPEHFGPIVASDVRTKLVETFIGEIGGVPGEDLDEDLLNITLSLQQKAGAPVDYYKGELASRWKGESAAESEEVEALEEVAAPEASDLDPRGFAPESIDVEALGERLTFDSAWVRRVASALHRRGQVIFYGPPGTGKTYAARQFAEVLKGKGSRVSRIQFHPSYTYEDFFAGYRPRAEASGQLVFELTEGPLRKIAEEARANPEVPHILLIDEINRANLSSVFGELYYLLEYRDDPIEVLYAGSGEDRGNQFSLPPNVLIIGTMNTADRSIALLDSAMRRRFSFFELHPDVAPLQGILDRFIAQHPQELPITELFDELNRQIAERDDKIGPSHLLQREPFTDELLTAVWNESILPLLEERYLGTEVDVHARFGLDALKRAVQTAQD